MQRVEASDECHLVADLSALFRDSNRKMNTGWKSTSERTFVVRKFDFGKLSQRPKQFRVQSPMLFQLVSCWEIILRHTQKTENVTAKVVWNRFIVIKSLNHSSHQLLWRTSQWLGLFLQFIGIAMVTAVTFIAVLEHHFSTVDPSESFSLFTCTGSLPCRSWSHSFY